MKMNLKKTVIHYEVKIFEEANNPVTFLEIMFPELDRFSFENYKSYRDYVEDMAKDVIVKMHARVGIDIPKEKIIIHGYLMPKKKEGGYDEKKN